MSTSEYVNRAGLSVDANLAAFLDTEVLPAARLDATRFWSGAAAIFARFTPENAALLRRRDELQDAIDRWHEVYYGAFDRTAYRQYLQSIGYLEPEPAPFSIRTENVDDDLARRAGPQLVAPVLNARFLLNAANARWGSLYDALYGSDVIEGASAGGAYDKARGEDVIARSKTFLDRIALLKHGRHGDVAGYRVVNGVLTPDLADSGLLAGYLGDPGDPSTFCYAIMAFTSCF